MNLLGRKLILVANLLLITLELSPRLLYTDFILFRDWLRGILIGFAPILLSTVKFLAGYCFDICDALLGGFGGLEFILLLGAFFVVL